METSVRELKAHLSEYLRRVAAGEEVTVTLRGKPVARLAPMVVHKTPEELEKEAIKRLDALPWIRPPVAKEKPVLPESLLRIEPGEKTLAEIVSEMRE